MTGATGFVGSAITLELLRADPSAEVLGLVRADAGEAAARDRLHATLQRAARLHGLGSSLDAEISGRCHALAGDVHEPGCGAQVPARWTGAAMWHSAASLQFHDRHRDAVMRTNVDGTRHALALAQALGVGTFNMVSTAYVAGTLSGQILEEPVEAAVNNYYERSKAIAEELVRTSGLTTRVLRPSIVIGHSRTRDALNFSGLYGFLRGLFKFRQLMERTQAQLMDTLEVHMRVDPLGHLDLVPVDFVARDAVALVRAGADPGVYHLTAASRLPTRRVVEVVFDSVGLRRPLYVEDPGELTWLDRKLDRNISIYSAYLFGDKRFDRARIDRWLERPAGAEYTLTEDELRRFCSHYVAAELAGRAVAETT